ncbi:hypothetical protein HSX10_16260 [Winogradskyella undariae]|uniref:hypothetical protein n=1 Tax=Winogradskyella undariae TaxID=1285465 RepID=UPI00156AA042|nr:hypothetical protein [Winogradskyella undariae]NRR93131.1 hypothetical protein [Winogradskyella undariae]
MYFFIDPSNLTLQNEYHSYGPVSIVLNSDGTQSGVDATLKYNITSKFKLTNEARAFACQNGSIAIVQSLEDASLVNVILKPSNSIDLPLDVKYYIYRGIKRDSLVGGDNNVIDASDDNNTLINRIWSLPDIYPANENLGYLDNNNIPADFDSIDRIFDEDVPDVVPCYINEGEWFGTFTKDFDIGFEILLNNNRFVASHEYASVGSYEIDVNGLAGYNERVKREEILHFIDPAAFFGMYFMEKVSYYDTDGTDNTSETDTDPTDEETFIYTKLISKFFTKNKLYLDIRSEKGYSYNLYQNYRDTAENNDNNVQVKVNPGTSNPYIIQEYLTDEWPILILESEHATGNENSLRLKLRINDNLKPILYMEKVNIRGTAANPVTTKMTEPTSNYIKTKTLIDNPDDDDDNDRLDWTNEFRLRFPNTQDGSTRNYISNYCKLYYFKTKYNTEIGGANAAPNTVLRNQHYYDSTFCSIDIPTIGNIANKRRWVESANPIYVREPYNNDGTGNFQLNMINGAYWDDERVLMYARLDYENSAETSEKEYLNTYDHNLNFETTEFNYHRNRLKFICKPYEIEADETINIIGINFFDSGGLAGGGSSGENHKENCMLLGLSRDQLAAIQETGLNSVHQRFIKLELMIDFTANTPYHTTEADDDDIQYRYYKYLLRLEGLDENGMRDIENPSYQANNIVLYSRDNQFFHSAEFSADEEITPGSNRPEFHIYNDGVIKISDNIDLALLLNADGTNSTNIYYKYYNAANTVATVEEANITDICNLEFVMADKMKYIGNNLGSHPTGYTEVINYNDAGNRIDGVSAGLVQKNNTTGDIVVGPTTVPCNRPYGTKRYSQDKSSSDRIRKIFMVRMVTNNGNGEIWNCTNGERNYHGLNDALYDPFRFTNDDLNIDMRYAATVRLYANTLLAAAVMGGLIRFFELNEDASFVESQGFAYPDGSSYPSRAHVNGLAFDMSYKGSLDLRGSLDLTEEEAIQEDGELMNALWFYGFNSFLIGQNGGAIYGTSANYINTLEDDYRGTRFPHHEDHIHAQRFIPLLRPRNNE